MREDEGAVMEENKLIEGREDLREGGKRERGRDGEVLGEQESGREGGGRREGEEGEKFVRERWGYGERGETGNIVG